jgi:serine/threonine-protein kinase
LALAGRPLVRAAIVVLMLVTAGVAIGLGSWSRDRDETPNASPNSSEPSPPAVPLTEPATTAPATEPPTGPPTGAAPTVSSPASEPALGLSEAVDSVISAVREGQAAGHIRDDVAVDLINLLHQLNNTSPKDLGRRVAELHQKIQDRIDEGSMSRSAADELQTRLDRVARV